jgi:hypothetical protein
MPIVSIIFGAVLVALGVWGFISTGQEHQTALIPAYFGGVLVILGLLATVERLLKHAMHAAAMIGLLGALLAIGWLVVSMVQGKADLSRPAIKATGGMAILCLAFVGLCVNSFIQVRRRRRAAAREVGQGPA